MPDFDFFAFFRFNFATFEAGKAGKPTNYCNCRMLRALMLRFLQICNVSFSQRSRASLFTKSVTCSLNSAQFSLIATKKLVEHVHKPVLVMCRLISIEIGIGEYRHRNFFEYRNRQRQKIWIRHIPNQFTEKLLHSFRSQGSTT